MLHTRFLTAALLVLALVPAGHADFVVPLSPDESAQHAEAWQKDAQAKFDLPALKKFLASLVTAKKAPDGTALPDSRLARKWEPTGGVAMRCGDWFFTYTETGDEFDLIWAGTKKSLTLKCARLKKDSFRVLRAVSNDIVQLHELKPAPNAKIVKAVVDFTVDANGVPHDIVFVESAGEKYDPSIRQAVSEWHLPVQYAGKRVRQPFEFHDDAPPPAPPAKTESK